MKTTPLLLFIPLLMTSGALAAGQDDFNVQTASSRMVKHEDGSRSYFEKTGDGTCRPLLLFTRAARLSSLLYGVGLAEGFHGGGPDLLLL